MLDAGAQPLTKPWWDTLPADFFRQPDGTTLDSIYPMRIRATAALDRVGRFGLGALISTGLVRRALAPGFARSEREIMRFYSRFAARGPSAVFAKSPRGIEIVESRPRWHEWRPLRRGIETRVLEFDSPYAPLRPEHGPVLQKHPRNRRVRAQYWTHPDGPRPTLIFLHGYFADPHWLNSAMFALPWLFRSGYDILLYTLPFHGARGDLTAPFSGYGYVAHGTGGINEAMLQAVFDLRILVDELERRGAPAIGVSGLSLGGYLSALLACVEPRLAFCIPNSPVVVPVDMGLEWLSLGWAIRATMRIEKVGVRELRRAMALHCPLSYPPAIDPKKVFIIGGAGDRFTPPRFVRLLHEHWRGSHLHWFPGNHVIHLQRGYYLRLMRDFMDRHCGLLHR